VVFKSALLLVVALIIVAWSAYEHLPTHADVHASRPSPTPEPSKFIDFRVGGIRLGDNEKLVIKNLGRPKTRRMEVVDNCGITEVLKLNYPGLEVQLDKDPTGKWFVLEMIVTSNEVSIEPQVKIGDEFETIKKRFENRSNERINTDGPVLFYLTRDNDNAQLEFKNKKVSRVRLYVNPC
jgi:hypothetical protein